MALFKYFDKIDSLTKEFQGFPTGALPDFDISVLQKASFKAKLGNFVFKIFAGHRAFSFYRRFFPVLKIGRLVVISRDAQVRSVLENSSDFKVPFGREMEQLSGGKTSVLGNDGKLHSFHNGIVSSIIDNKKDPKEIANLSNRFATALIENASGRIDVMTDLVTRVATEVCQRYIGLRIDDPVAFADWTFSLSNLLFADPTGDKKARELGLNGSIRLNAIIDDAIARTRANHRRYPNTKGRDKTLLDRLFNLQRKLKADGKNLTEKDMRGHIIGILVGFIPTNTLAAGNILSELLKNPAAWKAAVEAAKDEDSSNLKSVLIEAARLRPALSPGQWRHCPKATNINVGKRVVSIKQDSVLLVSTMSALRDRLYFPKPNKFWPERVDDENKPLKPDLVFGTGPHKCLGEYLAIEQIVETFKVLLRQEKIRPVKGRLGKMQTTGPFPTRLEMEFHTPSAKQSMFLVVAPVTSEISKKDLDLELSKLGHGPKIKNADRLALDATNVIHFASISTVSSDKGLDIIVELSVDGSVESAIKSLDENLSKIWRPIFEYSDLGPGEALASFMRRHTVILHSKPWGATGLNYNGVGEFSAKTIEKQAQFSDLVSKILAEYLDQEVGKGNQPMRALTYIRRIINQDRFHALRKSSASYKLMQLANNEKLDAFRLIPSRVKFGLSDFKSQTYFSAFKNFLGSSESKIVKWPIGIALLAFLVSLYFVISPMPAITFARSDHSIFGLALLADIQVNWDGLSNAFWDWLAVVFSAVLATILAMAAPAGLALLILRKRERLDVPDQSQATVEHIEQLGEIEDHPGYAQNHFMAAGNLKPGLFRTLVHTVALWGIKMIIIFYYRPGFVVNMGTIHYARWWRLPGTKRAIFFSNYDGSWDSYLEDFITRARWGQTAAWSNWEGFPRTKFLIFKGAEDGDRFKRWVRTKQQVVPFWYSRTPDLTTDQIRKNALIHHGVARIQSDTEAREWLRIFGSMPRVSNLIETDEVQSLVFRGMGRLKYSTCLTIKLPEPPNGDLGYWLKAIRGAKSIRLPETNERAEFINSCEFLPLSYNKKRYEVPISLAVKFGDHQTVGEEVPDKAPPDILALRSIEAHLHDENIADLENANQLPQDNRAAAFVALSAQGFSKFQSGKNGLSGLTETFPPAFKIGMSKRQRILGDFGTADPKEWRWSDRTISDNSGQNVQQAEAVLILYAKTREQREAMKAAHTALVNAYGGEVLTITDCDPAWPDPEKEGLEHFGYRDGISQPIIRGTQRFAKGAAERDIVEAGEFILGYENNQGFLPPSPLVRAENDLGGELPVPSSRELSQFPAFGTDKSGELPRDFGRNGSFLVIRELEQDVEKFERFVHRKSQELNGEIKAEIDDQKAYPNLSLSIGQKPDGNWIKAKLMGRWPDGRPLIGNPIEQDISDIYDASDAVPLSIEETNNYRAQRENDFAYGLDDPQGLACPFGAHIRRSNPRDSKQPGDANEQTISNRHRLLRRGRSYANNKNDKGLFFVALCADLERQFEFVQQTWINSPAFHGLKNEPDPVIGPETSLEKSFTIPTPSGPVKLSGIENFVTVRAGGYFFLPSKSALTFLKEQAFKQST